MLTQRARIRIKVQPGFLLLLGIIFYLEDSGSTTLMVLAAAIIHEAGHVAACALMKGKIEALCLSAVGAELKLTYPVMLSYGRENLVLLAGAMANLLLGMITYFLGAYRMTGITVCLGIFNLMPAIPLDGGRILFNLISEHFSFRWSEKVLLVTSGIFAGIFAGIGIIWLVRFANILPLILSLWLLVGILRKNTNFF